MSGSLSLILCDIYCPVQPLKSAARITEHHFVIICAGLSLKLAAFLAFSIIQCYLCEREERKRKTIALQKIHTCNSSYCFCFLLPAFESPFVIRAGTFGSKGLIVYITQVGVTRFKGRQSDECQAHVYKLHD